MLPVTELLGAPPCVPLEVSPLPHPADPLSKPGVAGEHPEAPQRVAVGFLGPTPPAHDDSGYLFSGTRSGSRLRSSLRAARTCGPGPWVVSEKA